MSEGTGENQDVYEGLLPDELAQSALVAFCRNLARYEDFPVTIDYRTMPPPAEGEVRKPPFYDDGTGEVEHVYYGSLSVIPKGAENEPRVHDTYQTALYRGPENSVCLDVYVPGNEERPLTFIVGNPTRRPQVPSGLAGDEVARKVIALNAIVSNGITSPHRWRVGRMKKAGPGKQMLGLDAVDELTTIDPDTGAYVNTDQRTLIEVLAPLLDVQKWGLAISQSSTDASDTVKSLAFQSIIPPKPPQLDLGDEPENS